MNQDVLRFESGAIFGNLAYITYPYPQKLSKSIKNQKNKKMMLLHYI